MYMCIYQISTLSVNLLLALLKCIMETCRFLLVSELNGDPPRIDCLIQSKMLSDKEPNCKTSTDT